MPYLSRDMVNLYTTAQSAIESANRAGGNRGQAVQTEIQQLAGRLPNQIQEEQEYIELRDREEFRAYLVQRYTGRNVWHHGPCLTEIDLSGQANAFAKAQPRIEGSLSNSLGTAFEHVQRRLHADREISRFQRCLLALEDFVRILEQPVRQARDNQFRLENRRRESA